ncbi:hypothetical protein I79_016023 [Cricetulus griseus]|uniref:Uncharacterized protein n=1 Tax=Cricetulus griseus TaxID=10029 RepID=G3HYA0_CRIGR|nr:hypothetical protein I79_016023 [Cricetulus griseus]
MFRYPSTGPFIKSVCKRTPPLISALEHLLPCSSPQYLTTTRFPLYNSLNDKHSNYFVLSIILSQTVWDKH